MIVLRIFFWSFLELGFVTLICFSFFMLRGIGVVEPLSMGQQVQERIIAYLSLVGLTLSIVKLSRVFIEEKPGLHPSKPLI